MARVAIVFCLLLAIVASARRKKNSAAISGRIIGGSEIDISAMPHLVSVYFNGKPYCGASMITFQFVLTAAHCVEYGTKANYSVRGGSKHHGRGGHTKTVDIIMIHSNYSNMTAANDIALVQLTEPFSENSGVTPIQLTETEPRENETIVIAGWGGIREGEHSTNTLRSVTVTVVSRENCQEVYKEWTNVTKNMFCAGTSEGGKDSCKGDSGGSAVLNGKLVGIISWGIGCGRKGLPGVYTNVAKYVDWIREQIL